MEVSMGISTDYEKMYNTGYNFSSGIGGFVNGTISGLLGTDGSNPIGNIFNAAGDGFNRAGDILMHTARMMPPSCWGYYGCHDSLMAPPPPPSYYGFDSQLSYAPNFGYNLPSGPSTADIVGRVMDPIGSNFSFGNNGFNNNNVSSNNNQNDVTAPEANLPNREIAPVWASDIQDKMDKGQSVNDNEKKLLAGYKKLYHEYTPYKVDQYGNVMADGQGKTILNNFGKEIMRMKSLLDNRKPDAVIAMLKRMPLEKRAAFEAHYNDVILKETGKKANLRDDIKESSANWFMRLFNSNSAKSDMALNMLDEAAMVNPRNMACALNQAINDHRIWGLGINDDRVAKLFLMMKNNPEFRSAVNQEYETITGRMLGSDISGKWFISSKNSWIKNEI